MSSPVDNPNYEHNPHAIWKVTYFIRTKYVECECQAPNRFYASTFTLKTLINDGYPPSKITWIKTERIDEFSES